MSKPTRSLVNKRSGNVVATRISTAEGVWQNFKGLMFRTTLHDGEGLVFRPARGIHTHFMRFPIDLLFLDASDRVTKIRPSMSPWRFDFTNAAGVIEVSSGFAAAKDIRTGDQLEFRDA